MIEGKIKEVVVKDEDGIFQGPFPLGIESQYVTFTNKGKTADLDSLDYALGAIKNKSTGNLYPLQDQIEDLATRFGSLDGDSITFIQDI